MAEENSINTIVDLAKSRQRRRKDKKKEHYHIDKYKLCKNVYNCIVILIAIIPFAMIISLLIKC